MYDGVLPWTSETLGKLLFTQEIITDMEYDGVLPWTSETLGKILFTQEIITDMEYDIAVRDGQAKALVNYYLRRKLLLTWNMIQQ